MTTHLDSRTTTDDRPVTATAPTRTIDPPQTGQPPDEPRRRGWLVPVGVAVGATILGVGVLVVDAITETSDTSNEVTDRGVSQRLVEDSIGQAVAERDATARARAAETARLTAQVPVTRVVPSTADAAERRAASTTSSQQLVQASIDQALADARTGNRPVTVPSSADAAERRAASTTSSQQLVQASIDQALAAAGGRR